jgi:hypothetical protein
VGVCALCLSERLSIIESKGWGSTSATKDLLEASNHHHHHHQHPNVGNGNGHEAPGKNLDPYKDVVYEALCHSHQTIEHDRQDFPSAQRSNEATFDSQHEAEAKGEIETGCKVELAEKIPVSKSKVPDSAESVCASKSGEIGSFDKIIGAKCGESDLILGPKIREEAATEKMAKLEKESFHSRSQICDEHSLASVVEKTKPMVSTERKEPVYSETLLRHIDHINMDTSSSVIAVEPPDGTTGSFTAQMSQATSNCDNIDIHQEEAGFRSGGTDSLGNGKRNCAKESLFKDSRMHGEISITQSDEKIKCMQLGELKEPVSASIGNIKHTCRLVQGNVLLSTEPQMETNRLSRDTRPPISRCSSSDKHKKNTLSSLFILDDRGLTTEDHFKAIQTSAVIANALSSSVSEPCKSNLIHDQRRYQHRSFSERADPTKYLFPVPETGKKGPSFSSSSWFSSLFWRRKKSSLDTLSAANTSSIKTLQPGWVHARQSWDAPKPSSAWGLSSFDRPRSSWEPSRPSWDGVVRASDGDSILNGIDFYTEGLRETTRVSEGLREQGGIDGRKLLESTKTGSKSMSKAAPHSDDKDRAKPAKGFRAPKHVLAQTTPPRSSEGIEIYIQQRRSNERYQHQDRQYSRGSHTLWNKVWTRSFSNPMWTFKTKQHSKREVGREERNAAAMARDDSHDRGKSKITSHELAKENSHNGGHFRNFHSMMERETTRWNAYYGPMLKNSDDDDAARNALKAMHPQNDLVRKNNAAGQKAEQERKNRGSSFMLDNGLLSFYLTPVRKGHTSRGKGIMMV